jgi:hypothetical protein
LEDEFLDCGDNQAQALPPGCASVSIPDPQ